MEIDESVKLIITARAGGGCELTQTKGKYITLFQQPRGPVSYKINHIYPLLPLAWVLLGSY